MSRVCLIGIGAGDPEDITVKAVNALNRADVVFFPVKDADRGDLRRYRHEICDRYLQGQRPRIVEIPDPPRDTRSGPYRGAVRRWYEERIATWEDALTQHLGVAEVGAFLLWGDPALYDGTVRILDEVRARGHLTFELDIVPGISALQSLTARHQTTLNQVGGSVLITTGRELTAQWPQGVDDAVVMLDSSCAFMDIDDHTTTIYWGAYLGTPDEMLISGPIWECGEAIRAARSEAKDKHGWVFDTYLLRRARAE